MEGLNVKKLSELEVRKQFQMEISGRFEALENCNESKDKKRAWGKHKKRTSKSQLKRH
jgi:hypothetical protein